VKLWSPPWTSSVSETAQCAVPASYAPTTAGTTAPAGCRGCAGRAWSGAGSGRRWPRPTRRDRAGWPGRRALDGRGVAAARADRPQAERKDGDGGEKRGSRAARLGLTPGAGRDIEPQALVEA
jgi:hypothetical protein